jgi:hypothetical protein
MQLSIQQTQELLKIIDKNQLTLIASELGEDFLTNQDKQLLLSYGINPLGLYSPELSSITTAFHFGMLSEALGAMQAKKVTYPEIKEYVKAGKYLPVSNIQKQAVQNVKLQTFASVKTLSGRIFTDVNNALVTQLAQQQFLVDELKQGIEQRKLVSQIVSEIGHKTGDWGRNFDRIIITASQDAFEHGRAAEIERKSIDSDPLVYKQPKQGACKHCIRLYLTNGVGSEPIIFKLSVLRSNGSNIGRKVDEWKATIDAIHPHCRCALQEVPKGYKWNPETQSFSTPDEKYKEQTAAKRKLIPVQIGEKLFML